MVEYPNHNLKWFLQLCDTFKYNRVSNDRPVKALKLSITPIHEEEEVLEKVDESMKEEQAEHHESNEEVVKPKSNAVIAKPSTTKVPL